jgi:hypothetical protein
MNNRSLILSIVVVILMIMPPLSVNATTLGTLDIIHTGFGANEYVPITTNTGYGYIHAGVVTFDKSTGTLGGNLWENGTITGFCIEPDQPYPSSSINYDVVMPETSLGLTKAKYIEELWGRYYDPSWTKGANPHQAAAFALAIWEIVTEKIPASTNGWDVTTGSFRVESSDYSLANEWLYSLDGSGPKANLRVFSNSEYQNYIAAVPEPATIALLGLGALTGLFRRKSRVVNQISR